MLDVVIVANFVSGLLRDNNRFGYIAELLSDAAQVELITSDFYHEQKKKRAEDYSSLPFQVTLLEEPAYPRNVCLKRFYSHWVFGRNVAAYLEKRKTPDLIYCAMPSLDAAKAAADYAKKKGVRFVVDVQDLWPEAFKMVLNVPIVSDLIFAPMNHKANAIYRQADEIIAVSRTYGQRALQVNRKTAEAQIIFLGTRLEDFDANARKHIPHDMPEDKLRLAYCGTLGSSYDLICVFDALVKVREQGITPPRFIVMGDGPRRAEFEAYAQKHGLDVEFTGRLPYTEMCGLLCACDITVNPIIKGSAGSIINKHGDYAASGLPVLNTQESREYRDLVEEYRMGFNCENGNAEDLAEKMIRLIGDPALRKTMGRNARRCAEERFDRKYSYQKLLDLIRKTETHTACVQI